MNTRIRLMLFVVLFLFICPIVGIAQSRSAEEGSGEVVAVINGKRVITRREVDEVIGHQLRALQEKIYDLRKKALDNLVVRILLEEEAQARGVMIEELDDQLVPEKVIIDSGQVDKVYAENIGLLGNMSEQEARQRIRLDLEAQIKMQKYKASLNEIRRRSKIDIFLPEPAPLIFRPEEEGPSRGPAQAAVTVVEFSDFQCPYCKQTSGVLNEILQTYKDDVRLVFKHLPLQIHPEAFKAAQASFCAREQGKFWPYHDRLFGAERISADTFRKIALELELNMSGFDACLASEASRNAVLNDIKEAKRLGVQGTPTFFVNGRLVRGSQRPDDFKAIIEQEIERVKLSKRRGATSQ